MLTRVTRQLTMLALLRRREFGLLWVAGLISTAGDGALLTTLAIHAYQLTGSALATSAMVLAGGLPRVLFGSLAGVFVDRWDRRRTMIAADLLRVLLLLPVLLPGAPEALWALLLVRAALSGCGIFFDPAENALLPHLVPERDLVAANAMNTLNNTLGLLLGPAAGGLVYAFAGLRGTVLLDGATFLVSAGLIAMIRTSGRAAAPVTGTESGRSRLWREWTAGLAIVRRTPELRIIFVALGVAMLAEGSFSAGFPALMLDELGGGPAAVGLLLSAQAIGGLLGGLAITALATRFRPWVLFGAGLIGAGLGDFGLGNAGRFAEPGPAALTVGAACLILVGFPIVAMSAASNGLVQTLTPDAFRGRVFGALGTVISLSTLGSTLVAGVLIEAVGVVAVFSLGALLWSVGGLIALVGFARQERITAASGARAAGTPARHPSGER